MEKKFLSVLFLGFFICCVAVSVEAATSYSETWDSDLSSWFNPVNSTLEWQDQGPAGNPGGYLYSSGNATDPLGVPRAVNHLSVKDLGFQSANIVTVSVDLFSDALNSNPVIRFRYLDSTYNGWSYSFDSTVSGGWQTFSFDFNPLWSDTDARAAGWASDGDVSGTDMVSFSENMSDLYTIDIATSNSIGKHLAIDNFMISAVPVPGAFWLLGSGLIGLVGFSKRKK